jgi:hypothetical protein
MINLTLRLVVTGAPALYVKLRTPPFSSYYIIANASTTKAAQLGRSLAIYNDTLLVGSPGSGEKDIFSFSLNSKDPMRQYINILCFMYLFWVLIMQFSHIFSYFFLNKGFSPVESKPYFVFHDDG